MTEWEILKHLEDNIEVNEINRHILKLLENKQAYINRLQGYLDEIWTKEIAKFLEEKITGRPIS